VADADLDAAVAALDLLAPSGFEAVLAGPQVASGRGHTVARALGPEGTPVVIRPVLHGGLFGGMLGGALVDPGRARRELAVTAALRAAGAPVPRPAFAAARRAHGPVWHALVATVREDAPDALAWLETGPGAVRRAAAAAAAGRALRRFHDAGGRHADLHVKNLLVREPGGAAGLEDNGVGANQVEVVVVDLDGAARGDPPDPARRMRELARLYRSLRKRGVADAVGADALRRFLGAYVAGDAALGAALARHWPRARRRVALHALRY